MMNLNLFCKMKSFLIFCMFSIVCIPLYSQVKISEEQWSFPTYPVLAPEKAPVFFTNENYQGASKYVYPYALNDVISNEKIHLNWKMLVLENEYIKLGVAPEIGGKLYYAADKSNDYHFIYKNNEVKPGNLGMTGAWVSGGIEWCVLHHHRASTFLPVDYSLAENPDGSKTIFIGETEPRHSMRWTIGISVYPGKSYFETEVSIYNPTPFTHSFLYWANVAAHTNENYQVIFPPSVQFATFHSKNDFTHWPVSTEVFRGQDFTAGVDISWWKNVKESASFFAHDLKEDFMGGYDHGKNAGTVHIGDHNIVKGAKLWEWGSGPRGQATEGRLTETSGPYVEIMVGAFSDNQPDYSWIKPYETKRWKQFWYPVKDIGGFKNANLQAAVNLEKQDENQIFLGYHTTQKYEKTRVILKNKEKNFFQKDITVSPETPFTQTIETDGKFEICSLYTELVNLENNEIIISYQPKEFEKGELPPVVEPPVKPEEMATVEEIYLAGKRIEQFYNPRYNPLDYYQEALKRDPRDIRSNTALGNHYLKNGDYTTARKYLSTAIHRLTADYTRPSSCEALYLQGLTLKALNLYNEAVDTLYRATWDYAFRSAAYFELAQISCIRGDWGKALLEIDESLSTNTKNTRALGLKASIQRRMGNLTGAAETLSVPAKTDPLNFRMGNELYLIARESGKNREAEEFLENLTLNMRNFDQNYLELAVGYIDDGMVAEAIDVLKRIHTGNPIVHYYLGYLQQKTGNVQEAKNQFSKAQSLPVDYCFPYRLKTVPVLETALKVNPGDGKAWYYLGNILFDKQPGRAMEHWKKAVETEPALAMAWRNLGWGYYRHSHQLEQAIYHYEKAISLNPEDAIFYSELDNLYELNNSPVSDRLSLFDEKNEVVKNRDDAFVRQITVLTLAGQPEKSVQYLKDKNFSYREGNSRVREVIIDAQLTLGLKYFREKNFEKALEHFLLAQIPDEEAGSARSGNRDIQVNYYIGRAYVALGKDDEAKKLFRMAAETTGRTNLMSYYKGLSLNDINEKAKAREIFQSLVDEGEKRLNPEGTQNSDFFAIFGERESDNSRKSMAFTLRGLGYKGLNNPEKAKEDLQKAVELSAGNLWAVQELKDML
jgi:tetratricopeptide (TPR) repeat protein